MISNFWQTCIQYVDNWIPKAHAPLTSFRSGEIIRSRTLIVLIRCAQMYWQLFFPQFPMCKETLQQQDISPSRFPDIKNRKSSISLILSTYCYCRVSLRVDCNKDFPLGPAPDCINYAFVHSWAGPTMCNPFSKKQRLLFFVQNLCCHEMVSIHPAACTGPEKS